MAQLCEGASSAVRNVARGTAAWVAGVRKETLTLNRARQDDQWRNDRSASEGAAGAAAAPSPHDCNAQHAWDRSRARGDAAAAAAAPATTSARRGGDGGGRDSSRAAAFAAELPLEPATARAVMREAAAQRRRAQVRARRPLPVLRDLSRQRRGGRDGRSSGSGRISDSASSHSSRSGGGGGGSGGADGTVEHAVVEQIKDIGAGASRAAHGLGERLRRYFP
ncbi:hypothetical protein JKP88DRAFT_251732 [Tribonema minus]|uniref:Uncharacterized protein n=1 Tax=Tribonema minus TaxID=303371 RepID=A0A835ZIC0_9STRA|nr:hypothetical protein JKP88DRAFT_251732 [Tribonema minus]